MRRYPAVAVRLTWSPEVSQSGMTFQLTSRVTFMAAFLAVAVENVECLLSESSAKSPIGHDRRPRRYRRGKNAWQHSVRTSEAKSSTDEDQRSFKGIEPKRTPARTTASGFAAVSSDLAHDRATVA
jgi:hypothetical protein